MAEQFNQNNNSGGGGSSSSSVSYSAATSITSAGTYSNQTYTSTTDAENALLVSLSSGTVNLVNPTVNKSGGPTNAGDNYNFYGINSGVMAMGGGTVSITGGTITTTGVGANGVFSYGGNGGTNGAAGDGTTVYISDATIKTSASGSGGIMTTGGGKTVAKNLTINTTGESSAPIRTDRGGGTVSVVGGSYTSSGLGSPAVYSTADITVESATLTSNLSEGVCIEGANSVALTNCTLTASNTQTNGNAQFLDAVILYQSQSGDAASGTSTFNMTGGVINNTSGHVFHVTNTSAVISLNGVTINDSGSGVLLSVCDDGWSGASNIATLNASGQTLDGDILVADNSTLTLNITDNSTFTGKVSGEITNNAGTTVSTSVGTVDVSLDSSSKWYLEEDTYISSFSGTAANVITGSYKLYANNIEVSGTTESDDTDTTPSALNLVNTTSDTLITGTAYADTISNTGTRVTIDALAGNDYITNDVDSTLTAASLGNSISAGDGNDTIYNHHSYNPTLLGGAGDDSIVVSRGHLTYVDGGAGNDTIIGRLTGTHDNDWAMGGYATLIGGAGNDYIAPGYTNNSSIDGGSGNDTISMMGADSTITGGTGDDRISLGTADSVNVLIKYADGDGEDYITGFTDNDTLSISGNIYSTTASGDDVIVTAGDGNITLQGAASLDAINIVGPSQDNLETATSLVNAMLYRTEAGYPVIAGIAFNPTVYHGDEPTNYVAKETWSIESTDGLELKGIHYTPENSNDKWVIVVHGYGHNHKHMYPFAGFYLANGYNVLMVDQRAAGDSQGDWLTMGTAESEDIALWTHEIASHNSNAKITLFGVSMGAATVMLTAARNDITNVTSLVEDCGYTNVVEIIDMFNQLIFKEDQNTIDLMMPVSESLTGYNLKDAAPINSMSTVKIPTLFIAGTADSVVGLPMLYELYDASGAEVKEQFIVEGATHGMAGMQDPIGYSNAVFRFVAEADGEGWETTNVTDDISLRGTSYNDTLTNTGDNVTIRALAGDDTIYNSGDSAVLDGGDGNNLISLSTDSNNQLIVLSGNTTIENFHTGWGNGSDTIYIPSDPAGVIFKDGVLTFPGTNDTLTLNDVTTTAKINIYHERRKMLNKGVFIAENDWYEVEDSDLTVNSGEEVYFVGTTETRNHGVDFSGVTQDLNITLNTEYEIPNNTMWVNGVYSIKGGAGLTTIVGSTDSDTILTGDGATTIRAAEGDDVITITNTASNLINYTSGDGNDTIIGFGENSSLSISGGTYSTTASGDDLVLGVNSSSITLQDAATLDNLNIIGTYSSVTTTGIEIANSNSGTLITGTAYGDTIFNTGTRVTIDALGGNDYIANLVDSSVTTASLGNSINAGAGDDTIYNYHTYNPTLLGGDGNDSIIVANGHLTYVDGGAGNDTIQGEAIGLQSDDWRMGGRATVLGGDGDDYIDPGYTDNSTINGGDGNDTIINNGANTTIDGGSGNNLISLTTEESGKTSQFIVLNGNTTVENFETGFGNTADIVYVTGDGPAVDFKTNGLTFYYDNDSSNSLLISGVTSTSKLKLHYAAWGQSVTEVFISDDDWYDVTEGTADYYVGATAKMNHGIDFSGVTSAVNVTLDTDYASTKAKFWVNNVYSIKGGAGLTTITGSAKSDTILTGTGATTIRAAEGDDLIDVSESTTNLIKYASGDGKDTVQGFDDNSTLSILEGAEYSTVISGDDILVSVNSGSILLEGAAGLSAISIINTEVDAELPAGTKAILGGTNATLDSDDKRIYVGKLGATLDGYTIDKAFVVNEDSLADLTTQINDHNFTLDEGKFYAKGQQPVVLEDIDTSKGTFVRFEAADGKSNLFGWSPLAGGIVDGSDIDQKQILFGGAPNGSSTITGGNRNDSIYADGGDLVELSGGFDKIYRTEDNSGGLTIDMADGSKAARSEVVEGFDIDQDVIKIDSANDISARMLDGKLALDKGNSRLTFAELGSFEAADGLKVDTGNEVYTLDSSYDSGISGEDFFWRDSNDRYYKAGTDFYIDDYADNRDYHIGTTAGNMTIDGFEFGTEGDALCLNSAEGLGAGLNDLYVESPDGKRVVISGGAGQIIKVKDPNNNTYVGQLGRELTYNDDVEYYGNIQGDTTCAISVGADYSGSEVTVYLNGARELDGHSRTYMNVNKIDASAFTGNASLVGAELDDYIIAAQGDTSLWGGNGGNDILVGAGYGNTFFYTKGDGNDQIRNAADGDVINLGDIMLDDISSTLIMNAGVKLDFNDGGSLMLANGADVTFKLADGTSYSADYNSHSWKAND